MNTTEKKTIGKMIHLYCKDKHGTSHALCSSCAELNNYAQRKLTKCIFGEDKPTCQNCKVHCYSSEMREKIKEKKRIRIIGDYDIDGVCSVTILLKGLKRAGADVDYTVPDRIADGYGINENSSV